MRLLQKFIVLALVLMCMMPQISLVYAADNSEYVGIEENDVFIWNIQINREPYENYLEDYYKHFDFSESIYEDLIDDEIDNVFDDEMDEEVVAWKLVIIEMLGEHKSDYKGDDVKYTKFSYSSYYTEDLQADVWEKDVKYRRTRLYKYYREMYEDAYISVKYGYRPRIVPKNMNWKYLVSEGDESAEDLYDENAGVRRSKESIESVYEYEVNGVHTFYDEGGIFNTHDIGEWKTTSKYNDDGILKYYEWLYDGDPILIMELRDNIFIDYWWITGMIVVGAIIAIVVIVIKKKIKLF